MTHNTSKCLFSRSFSRLEFEQEYAVLTQNLQMCFYFLFFPLLPQIHHCTNSTVSLPSLWLWLAGRHSSANWPAGCSQAGQAAVTSPLLTFYTLHCIQQPFVLIAWCQILLHYIVDQHCLIFDRSWAIRLQSY